MSREEGVPIEPSAEERGLARIRPTQRAYLKACIEEYVERLTADFMELLDEEIGFPEGESEEPDLTL